MRTELKGQGTPIPEIALPTVISDIPPTTMLLNPGNFVPATFINQGYTNFEVWCIGAAGGRGADFAFSLMEKDYEAKGGAGGGGGIHTAKGILLDLPALVPVVVGFPGGDGDIGLAGSPGGYSSFNGVFCQASGGKGGDLAATNTGGVPNWRGNGGDGGAGGRNVAGGGAVGGANAVDGAIGTWDGVIGKGGGGGAGGRSTRTFDSRFFPVYTYVLVNASAGGNGSFSYGDPSVYGPRSLAQTVALPYPPNVWTAIAGMGGGAKLPNGQIFGSFAPGSHPEGAVFIRLTSLE